MAKKQKAVPEAVFKYIATQNAFVDYEGLGKIKWLAVGDAVRRSTPAGDELAHVLMPVNELAMLAEDFDPLKADIDVLKSLAELDVFDVEVAKAALAKHHNVTIKSNDPEVIIRKIEALRFGQPPKTVVAGIDDVEI